MLRFGRRKDHHADAHHPAPLAAQDGLRLSDGLGVVIAGLACLQANVTQAALELQRALMAGEMDGTRAAEATNTLRNAHRDIESACQLISGARISVTPGVGEPSHDAAHHGPLAADGGN